VLAGQVDQRGERGRVADRQLGEDLAVHLDAGALEALDEAVVGEAVLPGGRVDAGDPQLTEVTLACPAVPVA